MADAILTNGFGLNNAAGQAPGDWDGETAHSVICFDNVLTALTCSDNQAESGFLLDWLTTTRWSTSQASTKITANFAATSVDFVGIGPCNWASAGLTIQLTLITTGGTVDVGSRTNLKDESPALFTFERQTIIGFELSITKSQSVDAAISLIIAGLRLDMEKTPDIGYMPGFLNNLDEVTDAFTEGMAFGPSRVLPRGWEEDAPFSDLPMSWIRDNWPSVIAHRGYPLFFAWNVEEYPNEVIFGRWSSRQITYNNVLHGAVALNVRGVV